MDTDDTPIDRPPLRPRAYWSRLIEVPDHGPAPRDVFLDALEAAGMLNRNEPQRETP